MTVISPTGPTTTSRTVDEITAELVANEQARDASHGAVKGMHSRKVNQLRAELAEITPADGQDADVVIELEVPTLEAIAASVAAFESPLPKIHDSDLIDGVRYNVDVNGYVWAPSDSKRLDTIIGAVTRDENGGLWRGHSIYEEAGEQAEGRTRRTVLIEMVKVHNAMLLIADAAADEALAAADEVEDDEVPADEVSGEQEGVEDDAPSVIEDNELAADEAK